MLHTHRLLRNALLPLIVAGCATMAADAAENSSANAGVEVTEQNGKVVVEVGGKLFTEYCYQNVPRPYFYPIIGPGGLAMTRNYPMKDVPDEVKDHVHHKSLWFTHGSVNKVDFWSDGAKAGKVVHDKFVALKSGDKVGIIQTQDKWIAPDGKVVCTDERTHRIISLPNGCYFDFDVTIQASNGEVTLGDTKEGSMAIRLADTMRANRKPVGGHIINSVGQVDNNTWAKRADWCEYHGPVQGKMVGVAIFDHPQNPRHPTWWHVRDYGLFAVNPFGIHDFERGKPVGAGDMTIPAGKSVTFRYRFYFHPGDEKEAEVAKHYQEYAQEKAAQ